MARLIRADGTIEGVELPRELGAALALLQSLVGGDVEIVYVGGARERREVLVVNEDGLRLRLPVNEIATRRYRGTPPRHTGVIVGDVVECLVLDPGGDDERYL